MIVPPYGESRGEADDFQLFIELVTIVMRYGYQVGFDTVDILTGYLGVSAAQKAAHEPEHFKCKVKLGFGINDHPRWCELTRNTNSKALVGGVLPVPATGQTLHLGKSYKMIFPPQMLSLRKRGAALSPRRVGKRDNRHFVFDKHDAAAPALNTRESVPEASRRADSANRADILTSSKVHPSKQTGVQSSHAFQGLTYFDDTKQRFPEPMHRGDGEGVLLRTALQIIQSCLQPQALAGAMYRAQIGAGAKASVVVGVLAELWGEGLLSVAEEPTAVFQYLDLLGSLLEKSITTERLAQLESDLPRILESLELLPSWELDINRHLMLHLVSSNRANGPCWAWSMFGFERL
ncbi:hypothetical protein ABBQ32_008851 [Trebouxia sp. C0010 RCD-2024]